MQRCLLDDIFSHFDGTRTGDGQIDTDGQTNRGL